MPTFPIADVHTTKSGKQILITRAATPGINKLTPEQNARRKFGDKK